MGVQYMQAEGLYSQFLQVGGLVHVGQHDACHKWKHAAAATAGEGGYFKALLAEGEQASVCLNANDRADAMKRTDNHNNAGSVQAQHDNYVDSGSRRAQALHVEDTKPLIVRSLEINGNLHHLPCLQRNSAINSTPAGITECSSAPKIAADKRVAFPNAAGDFPECKPFKNSIINPLKRGREAAVRQKEGGGAAGKREKKGKTNDEAKEMKGTKGPAAPPPSPPPTPTAPAGRRKTTGGKPKAPKPAPALPSEQPARTDYVHVRARRGQATDSHSLAERVRREKISERMRFLQDLVPGCSKITGKAVILDEIINYVQSLQNQVEFLAMRLAATNPKIEHASLRETTNQESASPFLEEATDCIAMLPHALASQATDLDLHFVDNLPTFCYGFFDDSNFDSSIVSDLSTSTCNDSHLTSMDFSQLG